MKRTYLIIGLILPLFFLYGAFPDSILTQQRDNTHIRNINIPEMTYVPAGEFRMGSKDGDYDEKPVHIVYLDAYYIGKYEVTNEEYKEFINNKGYETDRYWPPVIKGKWTRPYYWTDSEFRGGGIEGNGSFPVVGISWYEAKAYCLWLSDYTGEKYRLPTEAEWEKAARGGDSRTYPWGNKINASRANYAGSRDPFENLRGYGLTPAGFYDGGIHRDFITNSNESPCGACDMAGNVWEYCGDWYSDTYYAASRYDNPTGPETGGNCVVRGGGWGSTVEKLRAAFREDYYPIYRSMTTGFRVVCEIKRSKKK